VLEEGRNVSSPGKGRLQDAEKGKILSGKYMIQRWGGGGTL